MIRSLFLAFFGLLPSVVFAQANATIPDPDPEIERKSFQVADGFEVNLFASDPILAKPIQMNFDSRGRLWIASSEIYPHIQPGQKANDKILILEDTDGDGKADKTTVFADGLLIPTGVEPGDGGAYVANSTELLHFRAKADGKADKPRIVLSGFGTEDTHHILHTLRWGPEGLLYFNQSIYIHSHIETPHGVRRLNGGGIWWFRPETMQLDVFVRGFINTWGHHIDPYGQSFITDGANGEGITYGLPGAYYPTAVGAVRTLHGLNPGSPKHCGLEILSGSHLPEDWRGNLLTNDFRGHRVCRFVLKEDGSTFASQEKQELIKTNHPAFRPIDIKMGPDGAIYIADWYNPIIQHGEIDFRDPRRDHTHGRIWRVTAKGRPLVKKPDLVNASTEALLNYLQSPEDWTRHHAKRILKERGAKEVLPALEQWVQNLDRKDPLYDRHLLEGLWTYQALDVVQADVLKQALKTSDGRVRAAATRVLAYWQDRLPDALALLTTCIQDEHPRVRLEAVRSLSTLKTAKAAETALTALSKPMDRVLEYALWLTVRELEPYWLTAFRENKIDFGGDVSQITFALQAVGNASALQPLMNLVQSGKIAKDREEAVWSLIAQLGGPKELRVVLDRLFAQGTSASQKQALWNSLLESAKQRSIKPEGDLTVLKQAITSDVESIRQAALRLTGYWKVEPLRSDLIRVASSESNNQSIRQAAIDGLVLLGGPSKEQLLLLAEKTKPEAVRLTAIIGLASLDLEQAAKQATALLSEAKPSEEWLPLYAIFLERKGGIPALSKAIRTSTLSADMAKIGLKAIRNSGRDAPPLADALRKAGNLASAKIDLTPELLKSLMAEVSRSGDPIKGEAIYRRQEMLCMTCHAIGGVGGVVGPDMGSIGASAPVDYLIESLLLPNKAIKEGYNAINVTTHSGQVVSGIKIRENKDELVLRSAEDKEIKIRIDDIDEKKDSRSLMPDGLVDSLTRQELVDLVRFLSELGKVGPYSVPKTKVIRRWEVLEPNNQTVNYFRRTRVGTVVTEPATFTWLPTYSEVSGNLPLTDLPSFQVWGNTARQTVVRCQLDVTTAGKTKLKLNTPAGLSLWVAKNPIDLKTETVLDLPKGLQTLTFIVDLSVRKETIFAEIEDLPDSSVRLTVVGGK